MFVAGFLFARKVACMYVSNCEALFLLLILRRKTSADCALLVSKDSIVSASQFLRLIYAARSKKKKEIFPFRMKYEFPKVTLCLEEY